MASGSMVQLSRINQEETNTWDKKSKPQKCRPELKPLCLAFFFLGDNTQVIRHFWAQSWDTLQELGCLPSMYLFQI